MKNYRFRVNKVAFVRGYRFGNLLRGLLCGLLCVSTGPFLTSCGTGPRQTYLKNTGLSRISKVAIVASVSAPKVSYFRVKRTVSLRPEFVIIGGLGLVIAVLVVGGGTEAAIKSVVDHGHAGKVRERVDLSHFEETVAQSFMQLLKKGDCFQTTEYLTDKNQDVQQLSAKGYDAVIRLFVREISLKRVEGDNVGLDAYVRGQMEYLSSRKVVWDREEHVLSSEFHSLDYYKENGLKELDAMLERAGRNLAYDFVYLK